MPMFPDSGVPASDAKNSIDVNTPAGCDELWYSTSRCQPRFDPAAANAELAELFNLIMRGEMQYDCSRLDHIERAVRYINQRGLPRACLFLGGPFDYSGVLDPPITRYNDFMTLTVVPNVNNQAAATLNLGLGPVQILRNDGLQLKSADLKAGRPALLAFWAGYWYHVGLVASQVPIVAVGAVDGWVRTDGNDTLGDGTSNTPDKAFRTIQGAWNAIGSRYAASPLFSINIRLGIPGDYEGAALNNFGGNVAVIGDPNNRAVYRVLSKDAGGNCYALSFGSIGQAYVSGVNMVLRHSQTFPSGAMCIGMSNSVGWIDRCQFTLEASNSNGYAILHFGGSLSTANNDSIIEGNGNSITFGVWNNGGNWGGAPPGAPVSNWTWRNIHFTGAGYYVMNAGVHSISNMSVSNYSTTGKRYQVDSNGLLYLNGTIAPGDSAGSFGSQGQVFP